MYGVINKSTDEINALLLKAGLVSNPNLLDNPNFKINQRGLTEYTAQTGYGIDMWKMGSAGTSIIKPVEDGVEIDINFTATSHFLNYIQHMKIEPWMAGKTFTASIQTATELAEADVLNIRVATTQTTTFGGPYGINLTQIILGKTASLTFTLPEDISTHPYLAIAFNKGSGVIYAKEGVVVNYIKLEEGSIATPFQVPDPTLELLKCQAYYESFENIGWNGDVTGGQMYFENIIYKVSKTNTPSVSSWEVNSSGNFDISELKTSRINKDTAAVGFVANIDQRGYFNIKVAFSCEPT